jgi:hypothetical protein
MNEVSVVNGVKELKVGVPVSCHIVDEVGDGVGESVKDDGAHNEVEHEAPIDGIILHSQWRVMDLHIWILIK